MSKKTKFPRALTAFVLSALIFLLPFNIVVSSAADSNPAGSDVAEVNGTGYSTLGDALNAWTAGSTLKLMSDVTTTSPITVPTGEKHTLDLNGYGILMTGNDRVITINQGASLELNDSNPDRIHYITLTDYRGTAVSDSGEESVSNGNGVIKVTGGYLTGGYRNNTGNHDKCGAGVYNWGTFVMNGGSIVGNRLERNSGGAIRNSGYFTMNGGTIAFNKATGNGGGITTYVPGGSQGKMTMNGGVISDNYCVSYGGGLQLAGPFEMTGGTVTRNTADAGGSGIYYGGQGERFKLSGNPVIKDNTNDDLYMDTNATFMISDSLTKGADVHVFMKTPAAFTVGWKDKMSGADPSKYFTSDDKNYSVILNNGEAAIGNSAAKITSGDSIDYYSELSSAISAWTAGSTLTLTKDVTTSSTITVPAGEHTLDLNGYALKAGSAGYSVITVGGAELTINDTSENVGKITGGSVGQNYGGGVTVDGGTLTLKGGAVSGNANTYGGIGNCGGGVHVRNGGKFYMEGGEISGNTSYVGGGVCTDSSATTVSITGGVIKKNKTDRFGSAIWAGRSSSATFRIGGDVQIIDNISTWTSDKDGEASVNYVGSLLISGNPTVHGDWKTSGTSAPNSHINLDNDGSGVQRITLEGALTNDTGTPVITMSPIYRWNDLKNGKTFVFTKNWNQYMGTAHPADYFTVDSGASGVTVIRKDGEAAFTGSGDLGDLYITFDANGGESEMDAQLAKTSSVQLNKNTFTHKDLVFGGWNTKKDGSGTAYADGANITLSGDLTLYAQWKEPVASIISGETTTSYNSFSDAVNAWLNASDGATLKLLKDVSYTDKIILSNNKTRVFDLNGKTYTRDVPSGDGTVFDVNSGANFTLTDTSKEQTGVVTRQSGNFGGTVLFVRDSGSVINYDGGKLTGFTSRVIITWQGSTVNMSGGEISGNNLNNGDAQDGIVRTYSSTSEPGGTFNMTGGKIINNTLGSGKTGGAVYVGNNGTFNLSGDVQISDNTQNGKPDNVYLPSGGSINIAGSLADDASVGVTLSDGTGEFTNGWKDNMGDADPEKYFVSDNSDYEVFANKDGELEIDYPEVPDVSVDGFEGDYDGAAHKINVSAPDGATVKYGTEEGSYTLSENPTYTDAGTYTVYYEVSKDKHRSVYGSADVKIKKINATVTITGNTVTTDYNGEAHSADGYEAEVDTTLYDVTKDFTYSGRAEAKRTDAGKTDMGLEAEQFENTNDNFDVTFEVADGYVEIKPIDVTVKIIGHNDTVEYDGKSHSVQDYDIEFENTLYKASDFTFSGEAKAEATDAGIVKMGLKEEQFENTNSNFNEVTFEITDGFIKITPIDVTLKIIGHKDTVDYNGNTQSVSGYDIEIDNPLYKESDFTFNGDAKAELTDVGKSYMGLEASQFENTNENFKTVAFDVTDGYIKVNKADAVITTAPKANKLVYNGSEQELVQAGEVSGGTLYYALGESSKTAPDDDQFTASVPEASKVGNYYIWYKVKADSNHKDIAPEYIKVTIAEKEWVTFSGKVYDSDNKPVKDATVQLTQGNKVIDVIVSYKDGSYYFTAPAGMYNLVVKSGGVTVTDKVNLSEEKTYDIVIPNSDTNSLLNVVGSDDVIVVGGLNKEADSVRSSESVADDKNVTVKMTVEAISEDSSDGAKAISDSEPDKHLDFYDLSLEKTIDTVTETMSESENVLEVAIPCSFTKKKELAVYNYDNSSVKEFTESDSGSAGTYKVDKENGLVIVYLNRFSTIAVGYSPYFKVKSEMSLGGFKGKVSVKLVKNSNGKTFELNDVSVDNITFGNIPRGAYSMTIKWKDGAENKLELPFTVKK